jgi:hypothetical protein
MQQAKNRPSRLDIPKKRAVSAGKHLQSRRSGIARFFPEAEIQARKWIMKNV